LDFGLTIQNFVSLNSRLESNKEEEEELRWCTRGWGGPGGTRRPGVGFRVQGSGFRVQDSGFRVQGSGFRGWGLERPALSRRGSTLEAGGLAAVAPAEGEKVNKKCKTDHLKSI